ncbi:MAG TPA: 3-phosphoshikimate 1-carboxyvinyltransferase [Verrucomicrobiae bacterium]|nr:3-phosphoshikimate 1-carboxyvinyltransferase [Verrucomicrobiae bacterium]
MALPDMIEILPPDKPVRADITVPGSKSITNRALVLAALADGETTLDGALWSEDTQVMVDCLEKLGFAVKIAPDPDEFCNRIITVQGLGGKIPRAGTEKEPLELFVGNAGTAARFLSALVCLGNGVYRLRGITRMNERPKAALFKALRELGYRVESPNDKLPAVIHGSGPKPGARCTVNIEESSQFASALLLCAKSGGWRIKIIGENAEESPYVAMTAKLIEAFPKAGGSFRIEPDASSGSYFWAAERLIPEPVFFGYSERFGVPVETRLLNNVGVSHWPSSGWQVDEKFPEALLMLLNGIELKRALEGSEKWQGALAEHLRSTGKTPVISREHDLGDSIMTAIVLAPFALGPVQFADLGRLRLQECERVVALRTELAKCGAKVVETGDTLEVFPSDLHGAKIETYNDHRMAMCFAILGLKVPGIKIKNPECVKKTFPNFFQKLSAAPPAGLGVTIVDAKTRRALSGTELFAD